VERIVVQDAWRGVVMSHLFMRWLFCRDISLQ
jgi:hypothetical protein